MSVYLGPGPGAREAVGLYPQAFWGDHRNPERVSTPTHRVGPRRGRCPHLSPSREPHPLWRCFHL